MLQLAADEDRIGVMEEEVCGEEKIYRISMIRDAGNYYFVENDFTVTGHLPSTTVLYCTFLHCT